jgi:hypothetical protein
VKLPNARRHCRSVRAHAIIDRPSARASSRSPVKLETIPAWIMRQIQAKVPRTAQSSRPTALRAQFELRYKPRRADQ